jgi:hypothetical protein
MRRNVGDEWSFIQTLRHLNFASADLPWDEAPGCDAIP